MGLAMCTAACCRIFCPDGGKMWTSCSTCCREISCCSISSPAASWLCLCARFDQFLLQVSRFLHLLQLLQYLQPCSILALLCARFDPTHPHLGFSVDCTMCSSCGLLNIITTVYLPSMLTKTCSCFCLPCVPNNNNAV